ncbi:hypothetical protein [Yinghuangia aomiensis]|uniref:hypothetical protein n=1 Tax=Yinghuangia aomiensis TaxID=676205 RepID=UPI0031E6C964
MTTTSKQPGRRRTRGVRNGVRLASLPVAALLLSGCLGGGSGDGGGAGAVNPTEAPEAADASKLHVPAGFDTARAWQSDQRGRVYAMAPVAGVFVDLSAQENPPEGASSGAESPSPDAAADPSAPSTDESADPSAQLPAVIARKAGDGAVLWSSQPLSPLSQQRTPELHVVSTARGEYVVVVRRGVVPASGIARARDLVVVDSFPVNAGGRDVAATAHLEREVANGLDNAQAVVGDGGVLFPGTEDDTKRVREGALWNPLTGAVSPVPVSAPENRPCATDRDGCDVQDVPSLPTSAGILTTEQPASDEMRFGLQGSWKSAAVAPEGASRGRVVQVVGSVVFIEWYRDDNSGSIYALHDLATGALVLSAACDLGLQSENTNTDPELTVLMSPQGRYVAVGSLLFDLSAGTSRCYSGDSANRGILFNALTDGGTAYGTLRDDQDDSPDPVAVRIATKAIEPLPEGTQLPDLVTHDGVALFSMVEDQGKDEEKATAFLVPPAVPGAPQQSPAAPASAAR